MFVQRFTCGSLVPDHWLLRLLHTFGSSEDSGDGWRSTTWLCCAFRREDWSSLMKKVNFANRSLGSCLLVPFLSRVFVLKGDVLSAYVQ
jgi:hypothetical protein